jgi:[ribosomal protein S18]-alanine N-acetyltransferase
MIRLFGWLRREPALSDATPRDAASFTPLHGQCFGRGWSEEEFVRLLSDRTVIAQRALSGRTLAGFILSRLAAGEAEILSVAVAPSHRGRGLAQKLLHLHMRRLVGLGCRTLFLEVDEDNEPARRLYKRAGFAQAGRREAYYRTGAGARAALILRRDFA